MTTTISDFGKDIKKYLDPVTDNFETLIINRGKNTGVVIMSLEEYIALNATYLELPSGANEIRLDSAIEKLNTESTNGHSGQYCSFINQLCARLILNTTNR